MGARRRFFGLLAGLACAGAALDAGAQGASAAANYPSRPVRVVVAVQPGGNLDIVGRALAQKLTEGFGRAVVVENRPGASGIIGIDSVARAPADGYTLLMVAPSFLVAPLLLRNPPFDSMRDFTGVSRIATLVQVLVVHPSVPARNVRELIALARARPGELNCVTSNNGSGSHLAMELFNRMAGVRMTRIPFSGDAPALVQLLGGQVSVKFDNLSTSLPHLAGKRLRALGVTSSAQLALLPGVPAIAETIPGYEASIFNGLVAPAGTPREVLARIHAEIVRFGDSADVRSRFAQMGTDLHVSRTPEEFTAYLKVENGRMAKLIQEAGITAE